MQHHRLKAASQRRVLLDVLAVLAPGGRCNGLELSASQRWLEQVCGIGGAGVTAMADQGVRFINEQDNACARLACRADDTLQAALKLAAHAGAGLQQAQVQGQHAVVAQRLWYRAGDDALRQALDQCAFTHACLAKDRRVTFAAAAQDVYQLPQLVFAAQDRVQLSFFGLPGQVLGEFLQ